ncbi:Mur ligase family protein [Proteinivorax tanatarense]|uniref:Mur ligase family protein n=1 Tax=Proteinivorax tanatarense TaxID=1260629 RepID=A0AAU7VIR8_9FIRM
MNLTSCQISKIVSGELIGNKDVEIDYIYYDVLKQDNPKTPFLYIPYINNYRNIDSTNFIETMATKGAKGVLLEKHQLTMVDTKGFQFYVIVKDLQKASLALARHYRLQHKGKVISVTGSCGKTTSKEMINQVFESAKIKSLKTERNINGFGGASHVLFNSEGNDWLNIEVGVNGLKRLPLLAETILPDYLLVTNIYNTHFDRIQTLEEVASHKLKLAHNSSPPKIVVLNGDDPYLQDYVTDQTITFGFGSHNDYVIKDIHSQNLAGSSFTIFQGNEKYTVKTPLVGKHNVANACGVFALCNSIGIEPEHIMAGISSFTGLVHENYETSGFKKVIKRHFYDDSQHFNLPGLESGLETFFTITPKNGYLILGYDYKFESKNFDFFDLFNILSRYKDRIKGLYLIGVEWENQSAFLDNISKEIKIFSDIKGVTKEIKTRTLPGDFVYLKGDFHQHLRKIFTLLEDKNEYRK